MATSWLHLRPFSLPPLATGSDGTDEFHDTEDEGAEVVSVVHSETNSFFSMPNFIKGWVLEAEQAEWDREDFVQWLHTFENDENNFLPPIDATWVSTSDINAEISDLGLLQEETEKRREPGDQNDHEVVNAADDPSTSLEASQEDIAHFLKPAEEDDESEIAKEDEDEDTKDSDITGIENTISRIDLDDEPKIDDKDQESIINTFCLLFEKDDISWADISEDGSEDLHVMRGGGDESTDEVVRGGAGASNATKKKRDPNECLERLADLIKANVKDEDYPQVEELINEAKSHIGKSEEQKAGGHGTPAKVDAKGGGKGKGKSKNKGKKEIDELPRFDLSRTWPKALQTTY